MIRFACERVYSGWEDVADPDDIDVVVELERTTHEVYPALRELVRLYDAVVDERDTEFVIGTADYVELEHRSSDTVRLELAPLSVSVDRSELITALEELLRTVFQAKDDDSDPEKRRQGLDRIQAWIDDCGARTDVHDLYERLVGDR